MFFARISYKNPFETPFTLYCFFANFSRNQALLSTFFKKIDCLAFQIFYRQNVRVSLAFNAKNCRYCRQLLID